MLGNILAMSSQFISPSYGGISHTFIYKFPSSENQSSSLSSVVTQKIFCPVVKSINLLSSLINIPEIIAFVLDNH